MQLRTQFVMDRKMLHLVNRYFMLGLFPIHRRLVAILLPLLLGTVTIVGLFFILQVLANWLLPDWQIPISAIIVASALAGIPLYSALFDRIVLPFNRRLARFSLPDDWSVQFSANDTELIWVVGQVTTEVPWSAVQQISERPTGLFVCWDRSGMHLPLAAFTSREDMLGFLDSCTNLLTPEARARSGL